MNLLAFAASNSKHSINKQLVTYAAQLIEEEGLLNETTVQILDLNDYEMPIYSIDRETEGGVPVAAQNFLEEIRKSDGLLVSFAEHNGSYTAAYKNVFDWTSRIDAKVFQGKPVVMLATSPGGRGGSTVLATAVAAAPRAGGELRGSLSIPSFSKNFDSEEGVLTHPELVTALRDVLTTFADDTARLSYG